MTTSVLLERVSEPYLRENYAAMINEIAPKKLEDVVTGLEAHFAKTGKDLLECDNCGGFSPADLEGGVCPFCHDGAAAQAQPPATPETPVLVEAAPARKKVADGKKSPAAGAIVPASAPSLTIAGGATKSLASEKELNESIARIYEASEAGADSLYLIGIELKKIRDSLWQQRTIVGDDGKAKPKYKSYNQFVTEELGISVGHANRARQIAETFTRDQFKKYGPTWLRVLVAAPADAHRQLMDRMDTGEIKNAKELEVEVRQIKKDTGAAVVQSDATAQAEAEGKNMPSAAARAKGAATRAAQKKPQAAITVGLLSEQASLKFFVKPGKKTDEPRAARAIDEKPYAVIEAMNGVKVYIALKTNAVGEIIGTLKATRDAGE